MKKLGLLVMPLMAVSFLASCNSGGGDKPGEVKFSLSSDKQIEVVDNVATVYIDWTPTDSIKFESFTFTASPSKDNTVTFEQTGDPRPMPVKITFTTNIIENISGTLTFAYEDKTTKTTGNSSVSVTIPKPEKDVTKEEYNHATSLEGVEFLQADSFNANNKKLTTNFSKSIYYMRSEETKIERFVVKSGDSYFKYSCDYDIEDVFKYEEARVDDFLTPQTHYEINPKLVLEQFGVTYEDLNYDSSRGIYTAQIVISKRTLNIELTFNNKKLTKLYIERDGGFLKCINYAYEEKTPVLPCTLDFSSETCELKTTDESKVITTPVIVHNGTTLNYKIVAETGHVLPLENQIDFKITGTTDDFEGEHSYNPNTGEVSITLTDNVTITCQGGVDPSYVSKDEFNNACKFVGVELMQANTITSQLAYGELYTSNFYMEISDLNYHGIQTTNAEYENYWEHYAKIDHLGDERCTYVERFSEEADWSTPDTDDTDEWCFRPEYFNPFSPEYIAKHTFTPNLEYDNFNLVDGKYVYIGTTTEEDNKECDVRMELTFVNKMLKHSIFTVNNEAQNKFEYTYQYENIIPEWPL